MAFVFPLDDEDAQAFRKDWYDDHQKLAVGITVYDHDFPHEHEHHWSTLVVENEDGTEVQYDFATQVPERVREFIENMAEVHGQTVKFGLSFPRSHNENCLEGIRCPRCGQHGEVHVAAMIWTAVIDNGTDDDLQDDHDTEYDDTSPATCPTCEYEGKWGDFQAPEEGE